MPKGTMSGTGYTRIQGNGRHGPLGPDAANTFTSEAGILMDDLSKLEIAIDPTAGTAQQVIANGN